MPGMYNHCDQEYSSGTTVCAVERNNKKIEAKSKKSGRKTGQLDKMTPEFQRDIEKFLTDRSIRQIDLMNKYHISRNTLKKALKSMLSILQRKIAYDIMPVGKEIISPCGQKSESPRSCSFLGFLLVLPGFGWTTKVLYHRTIRARRVKI